MLEQRKTALESALKDSAPRVREAAAAALDKLEARRALPKLLAQLAGENRRDRIAAVYALGQVCSSKVFVPLLNALQSKDPDLRVAVARILGEKHHPKTLAPLVNALGDPEPGVVAEIATALGCFDDPRLPQVLAALIPREEQIALAAITSLGKLRMPAGEDALCKALDDDRPLLRCQAALALGELQTDN